MTSSDTGAGDGDGDGDDNDDETSRSTETATEAGDVPELSDVQKQLLADLPATTSELASALHIQPTTVRYHLNELDSKGVRLIKDNHTSRWMLAGYQYLTVSDSRLPDPPSLSTLQSICLGFLLIVSPLWFVWVFELLVQTAELTDATLTFFIYDIPPLATYHGLMYLLFAVNWTAGTYLIATAFFRSLE